MQTGSYFEPGDAETAFNTISGINPSGGFSPSMIAKPLMATSTPQRHMRSVGNRGLATTFEVVVNGKVYHGGC